MENASNFLISSILGMSGLLVLVAGATVINNIIHKYWKPIRVFTPDSFTMFGMHPPERFATQEEIERITPSFEDKKK